MELTIGGESVVGAEREPQRRFRSRQPGLCGERGCKQEQRKQSQQSHHSSQSTGSNIVSRSGQAGSGGATVMMACDPRPGAVAASYQYDVVLRSSDHVTHMLSSTHRGL